MSSWGIPSTGIDSLCLHYSSVLNTVVLSIVLCTLAVLTKRLARKSMPKMSYFVSSGMLNLSSVSLYVHIQTIGRTTLWDPWDMFPPTVYNLGAKCIRSPATFLTVTFCWDKFLTLTTTSYVLNSVVTDPMSPNVYICRLLL